MADTVMLTEHEAIRDWAAARMGAPAIVDVSAESGTQPMLRLVFDQQAYQDTDQAERPQNAGGYELVEWDDWFKIFDERELALVVGRRNARPNGQLSRDRAALASPHRSPIRLWINSSTRGCRRNGRRSPRPPPWPATPDGCGP